MQELMIEPAVKGTRNVINVAADAGVKRVIFTSSIGTVYMNPQRSLDVPVDENCWSDLEYCKNTKVSILYIMSVYISQVEILILYLIHQF